MLTSPRFDVVAVGTDRVPAVTLIVLPSGFDTPRANAVAVPRYAAVPNEPPAADVKEELTTFDANVVPVRVPAGAITAAVV
jgi:hypothetical protein